MDSSILEKIVNCASHWSVEDRKVSTSDPEIITTLHRMGFGVVSNGMQIGGGWVTSIRVGRVEFVHVGKRQLIPTHG